MMSWCLVSAASGVFARTAAMGVKVTPVIDKPSAQIWRRRRDLLWP